MTSLLSGAAQMTGNNRPIFQSIGEIGVIVRIERAQKTLVTVQCSQHLVIIERTLIARPGVQKEEHGIG